MPLHLLLKNNKQRLLWIRLLLKHWKNNRLHSRLNLLLKRKREREDKRKKKRKKLVNLQRRWLLKLPLRKQERRLRKRN